jgi:hypothetical protein
MHLRLRRHRGEFDISYKSMPLTIRHRRDITCVFDVTRVFWVTKVHIPGAYIAVKDADAVQVLVTYKLTLLEECWQLLN